MRPMAKSAPGVVNAGGIGIGPAGFVERLGELAAGGDVGEDDVAGVAEQRFIDVGRFADGTGDVEFHGQSRGLDSVSRERRVSCVGCRPRRITIYGWRGVRDLFTICLEPRILSCQLTGLS